MLLDTDLGISTFGEDEQGNLYVANYSGTIWSVTDNVANADTNADTNANADYFNRAVQRHRFSSN